MLIMSLPSLFCSWSINSSCLFFMKYSITETASKCFIVYAMTEILEIFCWNFASNSWRCKLLVWWFKFWIAKWWNLLVSIGVCHISPPLSVFMTYLLWSQKWLNYFPCCNQCCCNTTSVFVSTAATATLSWYWNAGYIFT